MEWKYTPEQLLQLGIPSTEVQKALDAIPALGIVKQTYSKEVIVAGQKSRPPTLRPTAPEDVHVVDRKIPGRDGIEIPIRIYSPAEKVDGGSPLIVNYHGGGYIWGDLNMDVTFGLEMVTLFKAIVVDVDYRLAPENPFPIPINDSWDALTWVTRNASSLNANLKLGFLLNGISAGGNAAAVMSVLAREEKLSPPLTGVFLGVPGILSPDHVPEKYKSHWLSLEQNKAAPILNLPALKFIDECYKPDPTSFLWSPILHPEGLKDLPRTYLVACGLDPLRDDAIIYEQALREAGVETKIAVYPGIPHGWPSGLPKLEARKQYEVDKIAGLKWLLRKE